jgi:RNA polymerase sigma factor (sigma-70 family)
MANSQGPVVFRQIRRLVAAQCPSEQSDIELLQQFIAERDEAAFAMVVQRHGTMVLEVSRSVLRHQQDMEDVFQAAFLVLARKAHTIQKQESLGSWLHGVAYRLALKARVQAGRRREREQAIAEPISASTIDDLTMRELRVILHEEVHRLGEQYRASLLLCYWEGKTRDEAAEQLGMSSGAFKKCLERARNLLGSRLVRRGLIPSSAFLATLFSANSVQAALPGVLINTTAQAGVAFVVGKSVGVSASAVALAEGAISTMNITKWATAILAILLISGLGAGFGLGAYHLMQGEPGEAGRKTVAVLEVQPVLAKGKEPAAEKTDKERIVGVWRIAKGNANGENIPAELMVLGRLQFTKQGDLIMTIAKEEVTGGKKGKYELIGPGKIDVSEGMTDKKFDPAIYQFDGNDRLTLCVGNASKGRPTDLTAEKGSLRMLLVLVRAKPGEEKPKAEEIEKFKGNVDKAREAAARAVSVNNLKQIGLAIHTFHDQTGSFPAHAIYSKDGKTPLLSWRVAILPYIDQTTLYEQFKLDESWDSPHNKKLIPKMPKTYEMPGPTKAKQGETFYQFITGPETLFDGAKKMKITDITDGTSNTLLAVEAKTPVIWSRPDDLQIPKDKDTRVPIGGRFTNGANVLFCDGSVRFVNDTVPVATFRSLITPAAGD